MSDTENHDTRRTTPNENAEPQPDPLSEICDRLSELAGAGAWLAQVKADQLRQATRQLILKLIVGAVAMIAALVIVIQATIYLLQGLAIGLTSRLGGSAAAGYMTAGAIGLLTVIGLFAICDQLQQQRIRRQLRTKYADKQSQHDAGNSNEPPRTWERLDPGNPAAPIKDGAAGDP
ncbi:MAG TPA: hypothetical protein P5081_02120 [Phycisphaerae bacterium]|nr:hypothetical protein [Phycisphaerae bacterium]HRW51652.1 hypothetical protein [Phycisphaerae bacterium]